MKKFLDNMWRFVMLLLAVSMAISASFYYLYMRDLF
jgi:hypothetical protein